MIVLSAIGQLYSLSVSAVAQGPVFLSVLRRARMAGAITESTAVLRERAAKVGLPEATVDQLVRQGVDALAKLAFAAGQPDARARTQA